MTIPAGPIAYLFVSLALLAESTIVLGLFAPGVSLYVIASFMAGAGALDWRLLWLCGYVAVVVGDNLGYFLGRWSRKSQKLSSLIARAGVSDDGHLRQIYLLVFYQFPVVTRAPLPVVLGMRLVKPGPWFALNLVASGLFTGVLLLPGYLVGSAAGSLADAQNYASLIQRVFLGLCCFWILFLLFRWNLARTRRKWLQTHGQRSNDQTSHEDGTEDSADSL